MIYDYDVVPVKSFDRNKSYYSAHYKFVLVTPLGNFTHYNILTRYNNDTKEREIFIGFYEEEVKDSLKIRISPNGRYKINLKGYIPESKNDYNIDLEYVESRSNPTCHIYRVSVV